MAINVMNMFSAPALSYANVNMLHHSPEFSVVRTNETLFLELGGECVHVSDELKS